MIKLNFFLTDTQKKVKIKTIEGIIAPLLMMLISNLNRQLSFSC